ncbi:cytochrome b/b6 domain-containing protein [Pseudaestuariivita sp.]|uniref:cytochrome b/b6 domain-containing protein n=1 Tax=Pseudaestuariivita sp. TaxID=2211669 RepID=UPI004059742B
MSLTNTPHSYGTISKTFHWLIAFLILGVIVTGAVADNLSTSDPNSLAWKIRLYSIHKSIGLAIFFTALLRILWTLVQPKPGMIGGHGGVQGFLAELVHWMLYGSLVMVPLTGWLTHAATEGFAPIPWPFGQDLPFVPNDPVLAERFAMAHLFFKFAMLAALALHIAGALKHHVWDKDATLRRMWFGASSVPDVPRHQSRLAPPVLAAVLFVGVGTAAALQPLDHGGEGAALDEVASDWRVTEGEIAITVDQFGTPVTGTFGDWTAAITYDPEAAGPVNGNADVTIAVTSLTLGSVTQDALTPDFLSAEAFPTATVTGDIVETETGQELQGTITIKGTEAPLTLPFDLVIEGDTATANGSVTLMRRDFNVGESMPDESTVGFGVDVVISLTATTTPEEAAGGS